MFQTFALPELENRVHKKQSAQWFGWSCCSNTTGKTPSYRNLGSAGPTPNSYFLHFPFFVRSLGNGVRNRCPYRRCGVDTEIPYRLFSLISAVASQLRLSLPVGLEASRQSILNFRIGFLSSITGRLPYPCLPTPFPFLRSVAPRQQNSQAGGGATATSASPSAPQNQQTNEASHAGG